MSTVMLINASPGDTAAYDFYFNDTRLNTQSVIYPSNSGYLSVASKNYAVKIAAANTINPLASGTYNLSSNRAYSVFAYDTLLSNKIKIFAVEDDISAPASGKAKLRFFHLSPANLSVDIILNDSAMFKNRSYADNVGDNSKSGFISVAAGTYGIKVRLANSAESIPPLVTINNVSFADGHVYTLFAKGKVDGKGVNTFGAEIITNK